MTTKPILLIGKPHSSKSVFLTQFYTRVQKNKSLLSLYEPVADLTPIFSVKESLAKGEEPQTTPTDKNVQFNLPISLNGTNVDLTCPEYGGEQIKRIIETREVDNQWKKAINESNNWLFFIRLRSINRNLDISSITLTDNHTHSDNDNSEPILSNLSEQSSLIELLQIFLHVKKYNYHIKNTKVKLSVVLTCWDELDTELTPETIMEKELPLLLAFIKSNWDLKQINILGLSAQGFPLNIDKNREKYQIQGPENFGYLIKQNGEMRTDITEIISEAL